MKAMFLGLVLTVAALTASFAADERDITVVNGTG